MDWLISLAGFFVGMLVGMTGVGGGALMTPLLILGFHTPPVVAVGTDLLFAASTKVVGACAHAWHKSVDWTLVLLLATGSLPTTLFTLYFLSELQSTEMQDNLIRHTLAIALFVTAVFMVFRSSIIDVLLRHCPVFLKRFKKPLTVLSGCAIGFLVTLSSIGAGALGIVFISLLYPRMRGVIIVGSDIAHAVPLTALAGFGHFYLGSVDLNLLTLLLIGSLPGIYVGSRMSHLLPDKSLRVILALLLFSVGVKMVVM